MPFTFEINGIECGVLIDPTGQEYGVSERFDDPVGATVWLKCNWLDRYDLIQGLLGTVTYKGGAVSRTPPWPYPLPQEQIDFGNQLPNRMVCTSIGEVRGIAFRADTEDDNFTDTGIDGWPYYQFAFFPAYFTVPLWQVDAQPQGSALCDIAYQAYTVTKTKASAEVISPPTGAIIYSGGQFAGKPLLEANAGFIRPRTEISITLIRMPIVPSNTLNSLEGTVNEDPFIVGGIQYPKGAVMFLSYNSEPRPDPCNFGIVQDVELLFMANAPGQGDEDDPDPLDWNYFMDPAGNWVLCQFNQDPPTDIFAYTDFTQFFNQQIS